jgi:F-type H+-transporting ATPase subunit gamma
MASLAGRIVIGPQSPKLLAGTGSQDTHLLVVCTSDRGLAGAFNSNIVRAARKAPTISSARARPSISTSSAARAAP